MQRKIDAILNEWVHDGASTPLLIRGQRRVGKTYSLKRLGHDLFGEENFVYCDFQANTERLETIFADPSDIEGIVSGLSLMFRKKIDPQTTLIAFDEVQLCEKALNSLRFFSESPYKVIASGSQLGLTLRNRTLPFPSGIRHIYLRPLDFEEFLWALDEKIVATEIRLAFERRMPFLLHDEALELYRTYCVVGGMPHVVANFCNERDFSLVRADQTEIIETYAADIALYAPRSEAVDTQAVWTSIPRQLCRETTRKFKYADVVHGGREKRFREPLAWLEAAELIIRNYQTNDWQAPLMPRSDGSFFKTYLSDTGILYCRLNLAAESFLDSAVRQTLSSRFRGAIAENYVMQALKANELETFYWTSGTDARAEVEFVVQNRHGAIIPIEVKSGRNVASPSLRRYQQKAASPVAVRISEKNFGFENGILSVPLYAAFCIDNDALLAVP